MTRHGSNEEEPISSFHSLKSDHSFYLTCGKSPSTIVSAFKSIPLRCTEMTLVVNGESYIVHFEVQKYGVFLSNIRHGVSVLYTSVRFLWHLSTLRLSSLS